MPPPKSNRKLTAAQKDLLKRWVEEGATVGRALGVQSANATGGCRSQVRHGYRAETQN